MKDSSKIGYEFTPTTTTMLKIGDDGLMNEIEILAFQDMVLQKGHVVAFSIDEIGCVNPQKVTLMVIFIVPHFP